jgi:acyl-CoA thioester hydrolase
MPLIHVKTFTVRHYECSADGRLAQPYYVRYMQEAAFEASGAAGYGLERYERMGQHWLVRQTEIEFLGRTAAYGEKVQVKTWVADFRRVRSRRVYELRLSNPGTMLARASTDWVFLDGTTGRPAPIPQEMIDAFYPEGPPTQAMPRPPFPVPRRAPEQAFHLARRVEWRDIDPAGHVNNAVYVAYVDDATRQLLASAGWPLSRLKHHGFETRVRHLQLEYLQPAFPADELDVATWCGDVAAVPWHMDCTLQRASDGAPVARARATWTGAWSGSKSPAPLPAECQVDLARLMPAH